VRVWIALVFVRVSVFPIAYAISTADAPPGYTPEPTAQRGVKAQDGDSVGYAAHRAL